MNKKFLYYIMSLLVIVSMLAACAPAPAPAPTEAPVVEAPPAEDLNETKPLVVALPVDMSTWDPDQMSTKTDAAIMEHIYDKLVELNDAGKIEPMVATEWELLEDNLTWRFKLRDDVNFWDGEHLTAETVKYVFDRALAVEEFGWTGNTPGFVFDSWKITAANVVDEYTIDIVLGGFSDDFLAAASEIYLHSIDYYKNNTPEAVAEVPVGSGPYKFVEWVKDDHITLERNEEYWGAKPAIKTITYRPIPEASTAVAEMLAGSVNVVSKIPPDQTETINASGVAQVTTIDGGRRMYVGFNMRGGGGCFDAMQKLEVRQALNMAVDVQTILESLLYGKGVREGGMVNPPYKNEAVKAYEYNPEKAKEMLAAAGYPDGDLGGHCELASPNGRYIKDYEIAQAVAAELQAIGVDVEAVPYEWSVFRPMIQEKKLPPMFLLGSGGGSVSAWYDLADFGSPDTNYVGWVSPEWDALVAEFSASTDIAKRKELTDKMQVLVHDDAPWLFLYMQVDWYSKTNDLNWTPRKDELMIFKGASWVQ